MRRKGERPIEKTWPAWDCGYHPVRRMVEEGDRWLQAWICQAATPWRVLSRRSGVSVGRINAIEQGALATAEEIEAFASVWKVDPAQVRASISEAASFAG